MFVRIKCLFIERVDHSIRFAFRPNVLFNYFFLQLKIYQLSNILYIELNSNEK